MDYYTQHYAKSIQHNLFAAWRTLLASPFRTRIVHVGTACSKFCIFSFPHTLPRLGSFQTVNHTAFFLLQKSRLHWLKADGVDKLTRALLPPRDRVNLMTVFSLVRLLWCLLRLHHLWELSIPVGYDFPHACVLPREIQKDSEPSRKTIRVIFLSVCSVAVTASFEHVALHNAALKTAPIAGPWGSYCRMVRATRLKN